MLQTLSVKPALLLRFLLLECLGLFMSLFRVRQRKAFSNPCERRKIYLPHFKDRPLLDNFL